MIPEHGQDGAGTYLARSLEDERQGDFDRAVAWAAAAMRLEPENEEVRQRYERWMRDAGAQGDWSLLLDLADELLRADPDNFAAQTYREIALDPEHQPGQAPLSITSAGETGRGPSYNRLRSRLRKIHGEYRTPWIKATLAIALLAGILIAECIGSYWAVDRALITWKFCDPAELTPFNLGECLDHSKNFNAGYDKMWDALIFTPILFIPAVVMYMLWQGRVARAAKTLGARGLKFSPGRGVLFWFLPIFNLFRPYEVVKELWLTSDPGIDPRSYLPGLKSNGARLVTWWWVALLVGGWIGWIALRVTSEMSAVMGTRAGFAWYWRLFALDHLLLILATALCIALIAGITVRQRRQRNRLLRQLETAIQEQAVALAHERSRDREAGAQLRASAAGEQGDA